jgi:redox-regulated HSP33 family molecular chaperone
MFGMVRVVKLFPRNRPPYESILEVVGQPLRAIINHVLRDSYQTTSAVLVSQHSDQSLMLHQLPPLPGEYDYSLDALRRRRTEIEGSVSDIFSQALVDRDEIVGAFAGIGFRFLAGREVRFECSCSRERMIRNILVTAGAEYAQFFDPGQEALDVTCEYCKSRYEITREALAQGVEKPN